MAQNVKCVYCGKMLNGFILEHNCIEKTKNKEMWKDKIGRKGINKTKKIIWNK